MHHRRSIRLAHFDYASENSYFITIVTYQRQNLFGQILNDEVHLSRLGEVVRVNWLALPEHFPNSEIDEFVVMPNHIHGIINLFDDHRRGTIYRAPTEGFGKPVKGSIPTIIRTFKAAVTRDARRESIYLAPIWQRNYFEHIIGEILEYDQVIEYIHNNPRNWLMDEEFCQ